jgi:hypothetical protein
MISPAEMAYFRESAARYVGKKGAIVDLGCWLGATSIALAQGADGNDSVFGFDTFRWEAWMPAHIAHCIYEPGESFLPEARRVVRDHATGRVELIPADLAFYEWTGGLIKILLVDAMKNETVAAQIARTFYPNLPPGALLIHQDFKHYYTSWIHVLQYRLRRYFRFSQSVPGGTVAFELLAPIPPVEIDRAADLATISDEESGVSFRHSMDLVGADERANIAAAHVMHYVHQGRKDTAASVVECYRPLGLLDQGEFPKALDLLRSLA